VVGVDVLVTQISITFGLDTPINNSFSTENNVTLLDSIPNYLIFTKSNMGNEATNKPNHHYLQVLVLVLVVVGHHHVGNT